jgi:alkylhydroperoxidase family enzyme
MSLLRDVEWEPCLLESRPDPELTSRLRKRHGRVPSGAEYFSPCPDLFESMAGLNGLLLTRVELDHYLLDLVGMVVSQDNSCRYCYAVQRAMMIAIGHSEEKLRGLAQEVLAGDLSPSQRTALEFARRMSRSNPLPTRDDARRLEGAGFSEAQVKELAGAIALHVFFNRISTIFALPPQPMEQLPERWFARLLRPLFSLYIGWLHDKAAPVTLREEELAGSFAPVIGALNGLPLARELRVFLDTVLADGALPAPTKGLIFAVVGRALGCPHSVHEGTDLALQGGIDAATVEEALDHLGSEGLDEIDNLVLQLARETVWYQPAPIQRRARQLRERMNAEQFIECVIAAAAANMVCRLGAVVVERA